MNDTIESLAKRIEELESQVAFQDTMQESLNTTVAKQDGEILGLKRQLSVLAERLKDVGEAIPGAGPEDETPPHY